MDPEDSLFSEGSEKMSSIIQYISTLSLTMNLEDESQTFEFPQSPNNAKLLNISRSPYKSIPDCSESKVQDTEDFENEQKLKTIKVEVDFLKQSIDYLKKTNDNIRIHYICFGPNIHQRYMMFFQHSFRHLGQIREVKAHPKYPKYILN